MKPKHEEKNGIPDDILENISSLPEDKQRAIAFLIRNINFVEVLTAKDPTLDDHIEEIIEKAMKDNDSIFQALLLYKYKKMKQEQESENKNKNEAGICKDNDKEDEDKI